MGISNNISSSGHFGTISGSTASTTILGLTGGSPLIVTSGYMSIQPQKTKYHILGTDIEVEGHKDGLTALYISMINVMGKPFYDEMKKQGVMFPKEVESFLEKAIIHWNREKKIDTIFDDKGSGNQNI